MTINFRVATVADAANIANIRDKSFSEAYNKMLPEGYTIYIDITDSENWYKGKIEEIFSNDECIFVAEIDTGEVVGYVLAQNTTKGPKEYPRKVGKLEELFVLPDYQRQGIGKKLFQEVVRCLEVKDFRSVILSTLASSDAKKWYQELNGKLESKGVEKLYGNNQETNKTKVSRRVEYTFGWSDIKILDEALKKKRLDK